MSPTVAIIGAAGETGQSIVNGLLEAGNFNISAFVRPASVSKAGNEALKKRGVKLVPADLSGPEDELVKLLKGIDVVISAIGPRDQLDQIPLANAAKKAGVKRFLPCGAIPVIPAGGIMELRDQKEQVYNHIKQLYLPFTIVDVGWWYQISYPRLPSGKIDYATPMPFNTLIADGNTPSALTDVRDIGKYVAKIIVDERTVNKYVLIYNEVWKPNDVYDLVEKMSSEKVERDYIKEDQIRADLASALDMLQKDPTNFQASMLKIMKEYQYSWGIRADNTPEAAKFLGYVTSKDLYPDLEYTKFEDFFKEMLEGKGHTVYEHMRELYQQKK